MAEFHVVIPEMEAVKIDRRTWDRFMAVAEKVTAEYSLKRWCDEARYVWHIKGDAPGEVVALFMALAQGHDINPILDRLENMGVPS